MHTLLFPHAGFQEPRHQAEIKPDEINDWIALGAAVGSVLVWFYRNTLKALALWLWNGIRAPQRIEEIFKRVETMQHEIHTTVGLARATWDSLPTPVWQSDVLGLCVHVNLAYHKLLGYQFSEVSGLQWKQVVYAPDKELVYEEWKSAVQDKRPFDLRYRWISKEGVVIPIHAHASIIHDAAGNVAGWVGFVTVLPKHEE